MTTEQLKKDFKTEKPIWDLMNTHRLAICVLLLCLYVFIPAQALAFLGLFGDSNVNLVKSGTFLFDSSTTIGNALEGNRFIKNPKWESSEDGQKRKFVIFDAEIDMSLITNTDLSHLQRALNLDVSKFLQLPIKLHMQFKINKNDTFDIGFMEFSSPVGSLIAPKTENDAMKILKTLYSNEIPFEVLISASVRKFKDAATSGDIDTVRSVIKYGIDPKLAFHYAVDNGRTELVKFLLENGANPNSKRFGDGKIDMPTPLHFSAVNNVSTDMIKALLEHGAEINAKNNLGNTPLHFALYMTNRPIDVIQLLLQYGAEINVKNKGGHTPLDFAVSRNNLNAVKLLLENGANPNIKDNEGNTPLSEAVRLGKIEIAKKLLESGADINIHNKKGNTPILTDTSKEMFIFLLENGADPNVKDGVLLYSAVSHQNIDFIKLLLKYGANPNIKDNLGNTLLFTAILRSKGRDDIVKLLLENGADPNVKLDFYVDSHIINLIEQYKKSYKKPQSTKTTNTPAVSQQKATNAQPPKQKPSTSGMQEVQKYISEAEHSGSYANIVKYSDTEFNLQLIGGSNDGRYTCDYSGMCTVKGGVFECATEFPEEMIVGKINAGSFELIQSADSLYCGMNGAFEKGVYTPVVVGKPKTTPIKNKQVVMPEGWAEGGDISAYAVKAQNGEYIYLTGENNAVILNRFQGKWVEIEYVSYSEYFEPAGDAIDFHVLYKVNGKNPLAVKN